MVGAQDTITKSSWSALQHAFIAEYCDINNPALIAEEAAFHNLQLLATQPIEEFHSLIYQKGKRLARLIVTVTFRFIEGLPHHWHSLVRAGRVTSLRDALHVSKIGEAHGYRRSGIEMASAAVRPVTPTTIKTTIGETACPCYMLQL